MAISLHLEKLCHRLYLHNLDARRGTSCSFFAFLPRFMPVAPTVISAKLADPRCQFSDMPHAAFLLGLSVFSHLALLMRPIFLFLALSCLASDGDLELSNEASTTNTFRAFNDRLDVLDFCALSVSSMRSTSDLLSAASCPPLTDRGSRLTHIDESMMGSFRNFDRNAP